MVLYFTSQNSLKFRHTLDQHSHLCLKCLALSQKFLMLVNPYFEPLNFLLHTHNRWLPEMQPVILVVFADEVSSSSTNSFVIDPQGHSLGILCVLSYLAVLPPFQNLQQRRSLIASLSPQFFFFQVVAIMIDYSPPLRKTTLNPNQSRIASTLRTWSLIPLIKDSFLACRIFLIPLA